MSTVEFWKFASAVKEEESLASVFDRFAKDNNLNAFEKEFIWASVNKDVEKHLCKTAADNVSKSVGIAIEKVMEGLPQLLSTVNQEQAEQTPESAESSEVQGSDDKSDAGGDQTKTQTVFDQIAQ